MRNEINDTTWALPSNRHATLGYFKIDRITTKIMTGNIIIFLKSTCDIGVPPSRAPQFAPMSSQKGPRRAGN